MANGRLICVGCAFAVLLGGTAVAQPFRLGGEFRINTYTTADQLIPSVAADSEGRFVVAWTDYFNAEGSAVLVEARRFDKLGDPLGAELQVAARGGYDTAVAGGPDRFVVTWESGGKLFGTLHSSSSCPPDSEFQISTYTSGHQGLSDVAMDANGGFVAVWENPYPDFRRGILARRYDDEATPLGAPFRVNVDTADVHGMPLVAAAPSGAFVVAWTRADTSSGAATIAARRYDSTGAPLGDPIPVDAGDEGIGVASGISIGPTGEFVVVWTRNDGDRSGIFARLYRDDGSPVADAFQVNTYTAGVQTHEHVFFGIPRSRPAAHDSSGRFLIAWSSDSQDGDEHGIFARSYSSDGIAEGTEIQVNTYTTGSQHIPQVAALASGAFILVWESDGQDGSGAGVFGQRLGVGPTPTAGSPGSTDTPEVTAPPMCTETPLPTDTATPAPATATPVAPTCAGDCNGDEMVDISELIRGVNIALGLLELGQCPAFDSDRDGSVEIAELIQSVNAALESCA